MKAFALKLGLIAANENKLMQVTNSTDQGLASKKVKNGQLSFCINSHFQPLFQVSGHNAVMKAR